MNLKPAWSEQSRLHSRPCLDGGGGDDEEQEEEKVGEGGEEGGTWLEKHQPLALMCTSTHMHALSQAHIRTYT